MSVTFTDEFKALPAEAPTGNMHIIDIKNFRDTFDDPEMDKLKIWDAVATLLFKVGPDALKAFTNPHASSFKAEYTPTDDTQSTFMIWRRANTVLTGHYVRVNQFGDWIFQWGNLVRMKRDDDNNWRIVSASYGLISICDMDSVWDGFLSQGLMPALRPNTAAGREELANSLIVFMLLDGAWKKNSQYGKWDWSFKENDKWIKGGIPRAEADNTTQKDASDEKDSSKGENGGTGDDVDTGKAKKSDHSEEATFFDTQMTG